MSDWLASGDEPGWPASVPLNRKEAKSLLLGKQRSRWLYESTLTASLVMPLSPPCASTIAIQDPNRTHAESCWSVHMTNYHWAYYQKSALAGGSGWGEGGGVMGIPTKPGHSQTKDGDKFLLLLTSRKNSFQSQMTAACEPQRSQRPVRTVQLTDTSAQLCWFYYEENTKKGGGGHICQGDRDRKKTAPLRRWQNVIPLWHADPTHFCVLSKTKHCTQLPVFCLRRHSSSAFSPASIECSLSFFLTPTPFFPLANIQLSPSFVRFLCDHSLEKQIK